MEFLIGEQIFFSDKVRIIQFSSINIIWVDTTYIHMYHTDAHPDIFQSERDIGLKILPKFHVFKTFKNCVYTIISNKYTLSISFSLFLTFQFFWFLHCIILFYVPEIVSGGRGCIVFVVSVILWLCLKIYLANNFWTASARAFLGTNILDRVNLGVLPFSWKLTWQQCVLEFSYFTWIFVVIRSLFWFSTF